MFVNRFKNVRYDVYVVFFEKENSTPFRMDMYPQLPNCPSNGEIFRSATSITGYPWRRNKTYPDQCLHARILQKVVCPKEIKHVHPCAT
uniref:Uncharacterized protein n=1 Tax=Pithovirus LCPAC304 TaxID=2506594 RepID=A0A481Z7K3_9VIRU|nr:MAG: hypothetical protein LCPAC304_02120 [Pithovirus LCPAC304]